MRSESETNRALEVYSDTVRRICLYHLKNRADTEDIFQNVFIKFLTYEGRFTDDEHEKAWFIRVTINACKDHLKSIFRRSTVPLDALGELSTDITPAQSEVLEAVLGLPLKYKDAIYLHYYEGYSALEIGGILNKSENTVYSLLSRGRNMLREKLGGDGIGE